MAAEKWIAWSTQVPYSGMVAAGLNAHLATICNHLGVVAGGVVTSPIVTDGNLLFNVMIYTDHPELVVREALNRAVVRLTNN